MGTELDIDDVSADWPLARRELKALRDHVQLLTHKVLTCGVAARHPDANLAWTGAYSGKWDSPQAQEVRDLRADRDRLQAEVERLRSSEPNGGTAWEPIATAPKDGTRILLAKIGESDGLPEFGVPPTPWSILWATMGSWSSKYQKWWDGVEPCGLADPNYWMRLQAPPNQLVSRR